MKITSKEEYGCFTIMLIVGIFFIVVLLRPFVLRTAFIDSEKVTATLTEFKTLSNSKNRGVRAAVKYTYRFDGKAYTGNTKGLFGKTELGYQDLKDAWAGNKQLEIWVSKRYPFLACMDYQYNWLATGLLLVMITGWIGLGIHGFRYMRRKKRK